VTATVCQRTTPFDGGFAEFFAQQVAPALAGAGAPPLACLLIEPAENTYPALPVRTGEHVLIWFSSFTSTAHHHSQQYQLSRSQQWRDVQPDLLAALSSPPRELRLAPTSRSLLR
jgi:hypothetical protein